jgi:hypothetical protein
MKPHQGHSFSRVIKGFRWTRDGVTLESVFTVEVELDQVSTGFRDRMKEEAARRKSATDGAYYFVACFESGEQASAFLKAVGMDAGGDLFIDGRALADRTGVRLPKSNLRFNLGRKPDPKLSALVRR